MQSDAMSLVNVSREEDSIYSVLENFKKTKKPSTMAEINDFIIQFYMKLQAM